MSLNVKRRNLTKAQTAIAAAQAARDFSHSNRRVAEMFDVSTNYVNQAKALVDRDPPAAKAVC